MNEIRVDGQLTEPGCYVDGVRGFYGSMQQGVGVVYGLTGILLNVPHESDLEACIETYDEIENALNDRTVGGYWMWENGDLMLNEHKSEDGES